jgi:uncharacterized Fe-S cluster-containing radical SAM superfamily protein
MGKLDLCMARTSAVETHGFMVGYCFDEAFWKENMWESRVRARCSMKGANEEGQIYGSVVIYIDVEKVGWQWLYKRIMAYILWLPHCMFSESVCLIFANMLSELLLLIGDITLRMSLPPSNLNQSSGSCSYPLG